MKPITGSKTGDQAPPRRDRRIWKMDQTRLGPRGEQEQNQRCTKDRAAIQPAPGRIRCPTTAGCSVVYSDYSTTRTRAAVRNTAGCVHTQRERLTVQQNGRGKHSGRTPSPVLSSSPPLLTVVGLGSLLVIDALFRLELVTSFILMLSLRCSSVNI